MSRLGVVVLALVTLGIPVPAGAQLVERVIDGEAVAIAGVGTIHLIGVDAATEAAAQNAGAFLRMLVSNKVVRIERDPLRRPQDGYLFLPDGTFVNAELVKQGYARAATSLPFKFLADFQAHEQQARTAKWGMWAATSATAVAAVGNPAPQAITVYVTRTGEKYHSAGCRYLARSQIPMALAEAAARFGACSLCRPPTISTPPTAAAASSSSVTSPPASVASGRCQATTKRGTQCSRTAQPGRSYCWQHGGRAH